MTKSVSPWVAWPLGVDPAELSSRLHAAHELFMNGGSAPPEEKGTARGRVSAVRRVVMDSWLRSRKSGVDPERPRPPVDLTGADLAAFRGEHALAPLMPIVRRLLIEPAGSEGMLVAIADTSGRLLWVEGDRTVRRDVERVGFVEGSSWSEQDAGTNAPGIALATDHEIQIFAAEHFTRAVQPWSCSAAPVHDPVTGRVLGALDITGRDPAASPQMLSLVRATVAAMESELAVRALRAMLSGADDGAPTRRGRPTSSAVPDDAAAALWVPSADARKREPRAAPAGLLEVLGTSSGTLVRDGERQALTLRHAELLLLLGTHQAGLTGEELAALLHPGTLSDVTVRAEMSRLRRVVGVLLGGSRPYRLAEPIRTDVDEVRELLALGDVSGAVEVYRGPVLPRSEAPGVEALREQLAAELRAALARTRDVRALEAWTLGAAGADDLDAWQRLLTLHPEGSPGWIRARAHADVLDLELGVRGPALAGRALAGRAPQRPRPLPR
ncbi:GAF domain-containing protein [Pengzhenrongella sp.]|jgi:hypothetical protein|uniref:GAF domain-containing protein n=1 Tax=Pengzhenrongella sp. TaxID=2888820 RepID=UPI002F957034